MPFRRRLAAAGVLILGSAAACAPPRTAAPPIGVDASLREFLIDPTTACEPDVQSLTATVASEIRRAHDELLISNDANQALAVGERLAARDPGLLAALTLQAQALLASGRAQEALTRLRPVAAAAAAGDCLPLALVFARSLETAGNLPEAFSAYSAVSARAAVAARQATGLSEQALDGARRGFVEAQRSGHKEASAWHLSLLERYWPNAEPTILSAMEIARSRDDPRAELSALKALQALHPKDAALTLRRGQLEMAVGDLRAGLALVELAAAAAPTDAAVQGELARAKFLWRMENAPEQVKDLRGRAVLSRADFAVLLYWTVPQIRTARPGASQIASDIVDHPSREAIARVANLGLMTIDEAMHRFSPDAGLRRADAVAALLRLLALNDRAGECGSSRAIARDQICGAGAACGLLDDEIQCQAGGGLSGAEAIEMLRRALDRLESR
ncbi:MAG: hypothetical protein ABI639_13550 [Thermoanaerobaculia bacterium]